MSEKFLHMVIEVVSENLSLCIEILSYCIKRIRCQFPNRAPPPTVHAPNIPIIEPQKPRSWIGQTISMLHLIYTVYWQ
jgi:hypothetical protein